MGKLIREKDWSKTVLGSPEFWPQSLRTALSIIINSRFPMFLFWGPDLICFYNDAYRPSLGSEGKHPHMLGMKAEDAWQEIWHIIKPLIDQVLGGGEATWSEDQLIPIYRNGTIENVYWTFSYSPVNDETGKPAGVFITCVETTEKVETYKKLQQSKTELEFAIEATELGTWDYNPLTKRFTSNARLKQWFGLAETEDMELHHAVNVVHTKDREQVLAAIETALQFSSGGYYDMEYTIINPFTKKELVVHAKGKAWFNENETAYRFNGTLEDVTEKAAAAKKLQDSEGRYHKLINTSPSAIGMLQGENFIITLANEAIINIWGRGPGVIGKPYFEALPDKSRKRFKKIFTEIYKTGVPYGEMETPVEVTENGKTTIKYFNFILYPQHDSYNHIEGIGIIATEVTTQALLNKQTQESEKRYRELSLSLEEKVAQRTRELNNKNDDLERMNKELQSFAYISSHDLQEPLRKIQTFSTRIQQREAANLSEEGKDYFARILNAVTRMQTLIEDLLTYSRTGKNDHVFESADLNKIVADVKAELREELEQKQAVIEEGELGQLNIIPFQFRQLLHNLFSNSLKFASTDRTPHIKITGRTAVGGALSNDRLNTNRTYYHLCISDNGIGFDPMFSDRIFEMFQRLHGKNEYKGTGIGLAIVKKIVENHGGVITATGTPDHGARFDIYLPING